MSSNACKPNQKGNVFQCIQVFPLSSICYRLTAHSRFLTCLSACSYLFLGILTKQVDRRFIIPTIPSNPFGIIKQDKLGSSFAGNNASKHCNLVKNSFIDVACISHTKNTSPPSTIPQRNSTI